MGLEFVTRTLLLGVVLSAGTASAAEIVAPAERLGSSESTLRQSAGKGVPGSQKKTRLEKTRLKIKDNKGAADTEQLPEKDSTSADKSKGGTGEAISESNPPAEAPHVALRGVRG